MDYANVISNLGFPIACAVAMGWYLMKSTKDNRDDMNRREDRLYNLIERNSDSMDKFNETLKSIDMRLSNLERKEVVHD